MIITIITKIIIIMTTIIITKIIIKEASKKGCTTVTMYESHD